MQQQSGLAKSNTFALDMVAELKDRVETGLSCVHPWQMGERSAPYGLVTVLAVAL